MIAEEPFWKINIPEDDVSIICTDPKQVYDVLMATQGQWKQASIFDQEQDYLGGIIKHRNGKFEVVFEPQSGLSLQDFVKERTMKKMNGVNECEGCNSTGSQPDRDAVSVDASYNSDNNEKRVTVTARNASADELMQILKLSGILPGEEPKTEIAPVPQPAPVTGLSAVVVGEAKGFDRENNAINKLIKLAGKFYDMAHNESEPDIRQMYRKDARTIESFAFSLRNGDYKAAARKLRNMESEPAEHIAMKLNNYVQKKLDNASPVQAEYDLNEAFSEFEPELYDAEAERNSMYCDACGGYHSGPCPSDYEGLCSRCHQSDAVEGTKFCQDCHELGYGEDWYQEKLEREQMHEGHLYDLDTQVCGNCGAPREVGIHAGADAEELCADCYKYQHGEDDFRNPADEGAYDFDRDTNWEPDDFEEMNRNEADDYMHESIVKIVGETNMNESLSPKRQNTGSNEAPKTWQNEPNEQMAGWKALIQDTDGLSQPHDMFNSVKGSDNIMTVADKKCEKEEPSGNFGVNSIREKLEQKFAAMLKESECADCGKLMNGNGSELSQCKACAKKQETKADKKKPVKEDYCISCDKRIPSVSDIDQCKKCYAKDHPKESNSKKKVTESSNKGVNCCSCGKNGIAQKSEKFSKSHWTKAPYECKNCGHKICTGCKVPKKKVEESRLGDLAWQGQNPKKFWTKITYNLDKILFKLFWGETFPKDRPHYDTKTITKYLKDYGFTDEQIKNIRLCAITAMKSAIKNAGIPEDRIYKLQSSFTIYNFYPMHGHDEEVKTRDEIDTAARHKFELLLKKYGHEITESIMKPAEITEELDALDESLIGVGYGMSLAKKKAAKKKKESDKKKTVKENSLKHMTEEVEKSRAKKLQAALDSLEQKVKKLGAPPSAKTKITQSMERFTDKIAAIKDTLAKAKGEDKPEEKSESKKEDSVKTEKKSAEKTEEKSVEKPKEAEPKPKEQKSTPSDKPDTNGDDKAPKGKVKDIGKGIYEDGREHPHNKGFGSFPCKHEGCKAYVKGGGYCPEHKSKTNETTEVEKMQNFRSIIIEGIE